MNKINRYLNLDVAIFRGQILQIHFINHVRVHVYAPYKKKNTWRHVIRVYTKEGRVWITIFECWQLQSATTSVTVRISQWYKHTIIVNTTMGYNIIFCSPYILSLTKIRDSIILSRFDVKKLNNSRQNFSCMI